MSDFKDDVKQEYPDLANEIIDEYGDVKDQPTPKHHTPSYILPIILTILMALAYIVVSHVQHKDMLKPHEDRIGNMEQKIMQIEGNQEKLANDVYLLAILHNENFQIMRNATGNKNYIIINKDWTIERVPSNITMSQEEMNEIYKEFVKGIK